MATTSYHPATVVVQFEDEAGDAGNADLVRIMPGTLNARLAEASRFALMADEDVRAPSKTYHYPYASGTDSISRRIIPS